MWCGHVRLTFFLKTGFTVSKSVIFSPKSKEDTPCVVLWLGCCWSQRRTIFSAVPSPLCCRAVAFWSGSRTERECAGAPPQKCQGLLASQPRSSWASLPRRGTQSPGWKSSHDEITCMFIWRCKEPTIYGHCWFYLQRQWFKFSEKIAGNPSIAIITHQPQMFSQDHSLQVVQLSFQMFLIDLLKKQTNFLTSSFIHTVQSSPFWMCVCYPGMSHSLGT